MEYQAVIFDFDYTLGDATEGIVKSANYALEQMGCEAGSREAIRKTIGLSLHQTYIALTGDTNLQKGEVFGGYFRKKADEVMVGDTHLFEDTLEILRYLTERGIKIGMVTTKYHYRMQMILEKFQAETYFEVIVGGEDVDQPKPDPQGLLNAIEVMKVEKDKVLYVGDSMVDAKTAFAAGVCFAGVTTGTTNAEELQKYGCVGIYENLGALQRNIGLRKSGACL